MFTRLASVSTQASKRIFQILYKKTLWSEPESTFRPIVDKYITEGSAGKTLLDAACGYGNPYLKHLVEARRIDVDNLIGMDIDAEALDKNKLHKTIIIQDLHNLLNCANVDHIISLYTWEHLHSPEIVLQNFRQALNPDGTITIIAPQKHFYISIVERWLPGRLKNYAWRLFKSRSQMPYPAYFKLCTESSLRREARKNGLVLLEYEAIDCAPIWFTRIPPLFVLACLWMTLINRFAILKGLRGTFIAVLKSQTKELPILPKSEKPPPQDAAVLGQDARQIDSS